jgi:Ca-activated chloride channel family protein
MLQFAWPWAIAAVAMPLVAALVVPRAAPLSASLRVPFFEAARGWARAGRGARCNLRLVLSLAAWAMLVAAACRPQWLGEPIGVQASGRSMLLALDISASMRAAALGPEPGLWVMRRTAREFVATRAGDRIGLIVFGTKAYVQVPLTFDLHAVTEMIDQAYIGLAGEGTALGDAIALAVLRLRTMRTDERVLVLLTDGSSTDGVMSVPDAARLARHHRVRVYAIGIGDPSVPLRRGEGLDEESLKRVAAQTGGRYFRASDAAAFAGVTHELERLEPTAHEERHYRRREELYLWPLGVALALALTAFLLDLRERRA